MLTLWLDRETFSKLDLKVVGTYVYAQAAEDLLLAYALDDDPVQVWDVTLDRRCPADLHHALVHADEVWAHNAQFDKAIHNAPAQLHLPRVELHRWRCSMAMALSHALPGGLGPLCEVLRVPTDLAKDKDGKKLIKLFCMPQPANRKVQRATRKTHPAEWARFISYAATDVAAMRECVRRMPDWNWNASAIAEWHCDQRINERGFAVDMDLVVAGARAATTEKARIATEFSTLTGGVVARPSQRDQFKAFVQARFGVHLADTTGDTFTQLLKDETLDQVLAQLMRLSMAANKTSTAKYAALHPAVSADGRFRGGLQFAGASRTRRWAGRLFQPQNLPSRGLPKLEHVLAYIEHLKLDVHDLFHNELMRLGAAALRGCVIVPPGKKMVVSDLSNIEGRFLAWVAGEGWKVKAFREFDAGTGPDLYKVTAASILGGSPYDVSKSDRNVFGKVPDLACLGPDTQVLTDSGLKRIVEVLDNDRLWDGQEWVNHEGLSDNGVRPTVIVDGITATPDHLINIEGTWTPAQELVSNANTLSRALVTGSDNLPSTPYTSAPPAASSASRCGVTAEHQRIGSCSAICCTANPLGAAPARKSNPLIPESATGGTKMSVPTSTTVDDCSTESLLALIGAATRMTNRTKITADAVSTYGPNGKPIDANFYGTCSHSTDGTILCSNLIENTSIEDTNPVTCDSLHDAPIAPINGPLPICSDECSNWNRVYDLVNAGPRHRFLVRSNSGWLLVHNSGYQGGVAGYQTFAHAYGVRMADHWGTIKKLAFVEKAKENLEKWGRAQMESLEISALEWVASETCKLTWRARHPATEKLWYNLQDACINAINEWDRVFTVGQFLKVRCTTHMGQRWMVIRLPSGRMLTYFDPVLDYGSGANRKIRPALTYMGDAADAGKTTRQWIRVHTHGGKLTGNVCQAGSRDILMPALQVAEQRGYLPILSVHDEALTEAPDSDDFDAEGLSAILADNPAWAVGLPLAAAGFEGYRYKKED